MDDCRASSEDGLRSAHASPIGVITTAEAATDWMESIVPAITATANATRLAKRNRKRIDLSGHVMHRTRSGQPRHFPSCLYDNDRPVEPQWRPSPHFYRKKSK